MEFVAAAPPDGSADLTSLGVSYGGDGGLYCWVLLVLLSLSPYSECRNLVMVMVMAMVMVVVLGSLIVITLHYA